MIRPFPSDPSIEFDRKQAKALLDSLNSGSPEALSRFREHHPDFQSANDVEALAKAAKLHDAQLVIAREYGLPSWRALVEKIDAIDLSRFKAAMQKGDIEETRRLLKGSESLVKRINDPLFDFGGRPVEKAAGNPKLMDVLLEFGADINLKSDWANGPFSVLDYCSEPDARYYLTRGAKLTVHAAARLGWIDELRKMLDSDPNLIHEKGGDGQRPLHFAKTTQIVDLLLDRGAEIDARCVDHHSTPAQYALAERPEVCAHLIARGATPDIFMPARLGEAGLAEKLIAEDPSCLNARINSPGYPPVPLFNIYCWSLGWYLSPHEVAIRFNQPAMHKLLSDRSPVTLQWLIACSRGDESTARKLLQEHPNLPSQISPEEQRVMPSIMFHNHTGPVKLMLSVGFDPAAKNNDGATLLHTAGWHGNAEIIRLLLEKYRDRIDVNAIDNIHHGSPLGWAVHGSCNSWLKASGDYKSVVRMLLDAGALFPPKPDETHEQTVARTISDPQLRLIQLSS